MLFETFQATLLATVQILLMAGLGYVLVRKSVIEEPGLDLLSNLLVKIFLPQMIFFNLTRYFDFRAYPFWWGYPLLSLVIVLAGLGVGRVLLLAHRSCGNKNHFSALMAFANYGYIPLMLVAALFQGEAQHRLTVNIFLMIMGFDFAVWSLGVWLVTSHRDKTVQWQRLLNPPFLTTIGTLIVIFLGWHQWVPETVMKPVERFADCTLPLAMIVAGGNLAKTKLSRAGRADIIYLLLGRLVLMPALALAVIKIWNVGYMLGFLIVMEAAVPSAVSLSMMSRYYKVESDLINQGIFWDSLLSVLTIPVAITVYNSLAGSF